jgi:hemerythrin-like domain-containing protein
MALALPSTGAVPVGVAPTCDTDDMRIVHGLLRALYLDAACLVRSVGSDQPARQAAVGRHIGFLVDALSSHHRVEDVLLWETLEQRAPQCALHVGQMRSQHAEMHALLDDLAGPLAAWRLGGGPDDGTVSGLLERIRASLDRHLGDEERLILPVASTTMTQSEWNSLGEMGSRHTPKDMQFVLLGFLLRSLPDAARDAWMRRTLPLPVRVLWTLLGRRRFDRYRAALAVDA